VTESAGHFETRKENDHPHPATREADPTLAQPDPPPDPTVR